MVDATNRKAFPLRLTVATVTAITAVLANSEDDCLTCLPKLVLASARKRIGWQINPADAR